MVDWVESAAHVDVTLSPIPAFSRVGGALFKRGCGRTYLALIPSLRLQPTATEREYS